MKLNKLFHLLACAVLAMFSLTGAADDTDIFGAAGASSGQAPNIIFILDNTSNWSKASQQWAGSPTQGEAELKSIKKFVASLTKPTNVALMMFDTSTRDGGYVRYGMRDASIPENNTALQAIVSGIDVNASTEKIEQSSGNYANTLYEAWLYITGAQSWAGMAGNADYAGNPRVLTTSRYLNSGYAYQGSANRSRYNPPNISGGCGKTYIIFIGNNRQGQLPPVPLATDPAATTLQTYNYKSVPDVQSAWARFLANRPDLTPGSAAAINGAVTTFTIDAYNAQQNTAFSTMMMNMAAQGNGKYYQAGSDVALDDALNDILKRVEAVNSVFASASLPVSVSVRGTYLNQVYLGLFRPHSEGKPNWAGNMKQYQLGVDSSTTPASLFLADALGKPAENPDNGFVLPTAVSFWTTASSFWDAVYYPASQAAGGTSDSPDGQLVEKGGAAQYLRTAFPTSQSTRNIYTCTGTCASTSGTTLSTTPFSTTNTAITTALLGAADSTERDNIINWVRGGNTKSDDSPVTPISTTAIRGFAHGDVLHSRPAVVNYGRTDNDIVVFYGANDGMLHAVKGGQDTATGSGNELWSFIAPEHFDRFKRMRDHTPIISASSPKPYFVDGSTTVYTQSTAGDGIIDHTRGDKAYLFVTMRRGGRLIYALDVSNPSAPRFLWKRTSASTGYQEMGDSWSDMKVAKLRYQTNPVLIFGLGYDAAANDPTLQATATMGRGVMVADALTGSPIWQAGPAPVGATYNNTVAGMSYAIPANVSLYDSNGDGKIDRIYAADTGANVWRINVDDPTPSNWTVTKLAALGGTGVNARKFLYAPDIIPASSANAFDTLLLGSGDREHPFETTVQNRYYMIKDDHALNAVRATAIVEATAGATTGEAGKLYDASANLVQVGTAAQASAAKAALQVASGWYIKLATGEKAVSGSTTLSGTVIFGTNTPASANNNSCTSSLGEARLYMLSYLDGSATFDVNQSGTLTLVDRYQVRAGGGYPPTPIPISVRIGGKSYQAAISGTKVITPPSPGLNRRYRTYWHRAID